MTRNRKPKTIASNLLGPVKESKKR
uniref:Uncharacterized protein n=1 Tax=Arundo donax TaxID=35708 RepID=A0A0A9CLS2_ARUDO